MDLILAITIDFFFDHRYTFFFLIFIIRGCTGVNASPSVLRLLACLPMSRGSHTSRCGSPDRGGIQTVGVCSTLTVWWAVHFLADNEIFLTMLAVRWVVDETVTLLALGREW